MLTLNVFTAAAVLSTFVAGLPLPPTQYEVSTAQLPVPLTIATSSNHEDISKRALMINIATLKKYMDKAKPMMDRARPMMAKAKPMVAPLVAKAKPMMEKVKPMIPSRYRDKFSALNAKHNPFAAGGFFRSKPEVPPGPKFRESMFPKTPAGANQDFHFQKPPTPKQDKDDAAKALPAPPPLTPAQQLAAAPAPKPLPADAPGPQFRQSQYPKMPVGANNNFGFATPNNVL